MPRTSQRRPQAVRREIVPFDEKKATAQIVTLVESRRGQLLDLLGKDERIVDRFITVALDAVTKNRDLLTAEPLSLLASIRAAAQMGLEPSGVLGDGAIVAYRDDDSGQRIAQFQPMYRGLMRLARNSGEIMAIDAAIRYEKDEFEYQRGTDPKIVHRPSLEEDPGSMLGVYAFAKLRSGELVVRYLSAAKVQRIRDKASRQWQRSGEKSVWGQWPEPMWLKTAIRELAKFLPLTPQAQAALAYDDVVDMIREGVTVRQVPQIGEGQPGGRLRARFVSDAEVVEPSGSPVGAQDGHSGPEGTEAVSSATSGDPGPQEPSVTAAACAARFSPDDPEACAEPIGHEGSHKGSAGSIWPQVKS